ncbi:MAG: EamA family transporter, partial [Sedimentibacter sp.]
KFNYSMLPAISGFISAIFSGAAYIFIRLIGNKESAYTTVFYFSFFSSLSCIPFFFIKFVLPSFYEFVMLLFLGVLAALGQISLTLAYSVCQASEISIYDYSSIIFSSVLAYLFLSEIPDLLSIFGGILILSASVVLYINTKNSSS